MTAAWPTKPHLISIRRSCAAVLLFATLLASAPRTALAMPPNDVAAGRGGAAQRLPPHGRRPRFASGVSTLAKDVLLSTVVAATLTACSGKFVGTPKVEADRERALSTNPVRSSRSRAAVLKVLEVVQSQLPSGLRIDDSRYAVLKGPTPVMVVTFRTKGSKVRRGVAVHHPDLGRTVTVLQTGSRPPLVDSKRRVASHVREKIEKKLGSLPETTWNAIGNLWWQLPPPQEKRGLRRLAQQLDIPSQS